MPSFLRSSRPRAVGLLLLSAMVVGLAAANAWVSDDASITLRTIDNLQHGHGLRWNVAEDVHAFTHPL